MLDKYVKDKRVAVIGNASNTKGGGKGEEIDSFDVVIRINLWLPKEEEKVDIGSRTDLFYIGTYIWNDSPEFLPFKEEWEKTGKFKGIPAILKNFDIVGELKCGLTGVICLYDCIRSGCKELHAYGFDCLSTPDRYSGDSKENLPDIELKAYQRALDLIKNLSDTTSNFFLQPELLTKLWRRSVPRETFLTPYVAGKRVSVVGAAESIFDNGDKNGEEIDSRDIVIRSNMSNPIPEKDYPYVGKRTDLIYCNNFNYDNLVVDGKICGIKAVNQPRNENHIENDIIFKFGNLLQDGKSWCPMSGLCCIYTVCISGAREIYVSGFDFYRSNNRLEGQMVKAGEREALLPSSGRWNNTLKDELVFRILVQKYPIKVDNVLTNILSQDVS